MAKPIEAVHAAFGLRIRMMREILGLTQEELAKRMKISRPSLVNIETARQRVLLHTVEDFAQALGTNPKHLLKGIWW